MAAVDNEDDYEVGFDYGYADRAARVAAARDRVRNRARISAADIAGIEEGLLLASWTVNGATHETEGVDALVPQWPGLCCAICGQFVINTISTETPWTHIVVIEYEADQRPVWIRASHCSEAMTLDGAEPAEVVELLGTGMGLGPEAEPDWDRFGNEEATLEERRSRARRVGDGGTGRLSVDDPADQHVPTVRSAADLLAVIEEELGLVDRTVPDAERPSEEEMVEIRARVARLRLDPETHDAVEAVKRAIGGGISVSPKWRAEQAAKKAAAKKTAKRPARLRRTEPEYPWLDVPAHGEDLV